MEYCVFYFKKCSKYFKKGTKIKALTFIELIINISKL